MPQAEAIAGSPGRFQALLSVAIAGFGVFFALALPLSNGWDIWCNRDLEQHGQVTTARFGSSYSCPSKVDPEAVCHRLHYMIGKQSYTGWTTREDLDRGQVILIRYAPLNPSYFQLTDQTSTSRWNENLAPRLLISCSLSLVFMLVSLAVLKKSWHQLKLSGTLNEGRM